MIGEWSDYFLFPSDCDVPSDVMNTDQSGGVTRLLEMEKEYHHLYTSRPIWLPVLVV